MKNLIKYWPLLLILVLAAVMFFVGKSNAQKLA